MSDQDYLAPVFTYRLAHSVMRLDIQPDITLQESTWLNIFITMALAKQRVDYETMLRKYNLLRHFRDITEGHVYTSEVSFAERGLI